MEGKIEISLLGTEDYTTMLSLLTRYVIEDSPSLIEKEHFGHCFCCNHCRGNSEHANEIQHDEECIWNETVKFLEKFGTLNLVEVEQ